MKLFKILTTFLLILHISPTQAYAIDIPDILNTTYQYDNASRMTAINHQPSAINYSYTYNDIGNRTNLTEPLGAHNYEYDDIDQLIQATHPVLPEENFTYDALGNRNPLTNTYNTANRLLSDDQYTYTYDANGNRITREDIDTGEVTTYHYNTENQLITINYPLSTINYYYDGLGRRIEKNVGGGVTRYIYDGMDVLAEYNGANELIRSYVHGPSIDEPLELNAGPTTYYYISDGLGSITALIDSAGNIVEQYRYDSFGNPTILAPDDTIRNSSFIINNYLFTAREYDAETGLYYYRLRYYDPLVGRFLQEDPVGYLLGLNLYAYVNNNPVNWIDPFGLGPENENGDRSGSLQPILINGRLFYQDPNDPNRRYLAKMPYPETTALLDLPGDITSRLGTQLNPTPERVLRWGGRVLKEAGYKVVGKAIGIAGILAEPGGTGKVTGIIIGGTIVGGIGGTVGTAVAPGVGTAVGGIVGGVIGGYIGGKIGSKFDSPYAGDLY